jgi:hypothetical protein
MAIERAAWIDDDGTGTKGSVLNNARLQADVYDRMDRIFTFGCRVYNIEKQILDSATFTAVRFDVEDYDRGGFWRGFTTRTRLTVPTTGIYLVCGTVSFTNNATGQRVLQLRLNGSGSGITGVAAQVSNLSGTYLAVPTLVTVLSLTAGDYIELFAYQDSGSQLTLQAESGPQYWSNSFMIKRLA